MRIRLVSLESCPGAKDLLAALTKVGNSGHDMVALDVSCNTCGESLSSTHFASSLANTLPGGEGGDCVTKTNH